MDTNEALRQQRKRAELATAFVRANPTSRNGIKTVEQLYNYIKNNPGEAEEFLKTQSGLEHPEVQQLADAFQAAEHLSEMSQHGTDSMHGDTGHGSMGGHGGASPAGAAIAGALSLLPKGEVKLAEAALTMPSPNVNLYDMVPTEILGDTDYRKNVSDLQQAKIEELKSKYPNRKFKKEELDRYLFDQRDSIYMNALTNYASTSERANKVSLAREKDIYIKDANGRIVGEKIFTNKKGKPDPYADPLYRSYQRQKQKAIDAAHLQRTLDKKNKVKVKYDNYQLSQIISLQYDAHFAALFPEKAAAYAKTDPDLRRSLKLIAKAESRLQRKDAKDAQKAQPSRATSTAPPVNEPPTVRGYQKKWNDSKLKAAADKGRNRFAAATEIKNWRVWKNWKKTPEKKTEEQTSQAPQSSPSTPSYQQGRSFNPRFWNSKGTPSLNTKLGRIASGKTRPGRLAKAGISKIGGAPGKLATKGVQQLATRLLMEPHVALVVGCGAACVLIVIGIIYFIVLASGGGGNTSFGGTPPGSGPIPGTPLKNTNPVPGLTISLTGPAQVPNSENIVYTVNLTIDETKLPGPIGGISIFDDIPPGTSFAGSSGVTSNISTGTVSWSLANSSNRNSFTINLKPTINDTTVNNSVYATLTASSSAGTNNTCNGQYLLNNPLGNFGDPSCNFTKDDLYNQLKSQDPSNANKWYLIIIPCESGYNPNAYLAASASGLGAYGLFQMNPSGKGNGQYDGGDVNWPSQTNNAINYNKQIGNSFAYWACNK